MRQQAIMAVMAVTSMLCGTASAQEYAGTVMLEQGQPAPGPHHPSPVLDFKVGMLAVEPFEMGDPVENAPYSADIVNELTQELPDGNRIERRTTGTVARDGSGRVRREHQLAAIGPVVPDGDARMVTISDPVARAHYSLDSARKLAIRSQPPRVRTSIGGQAATGRATSMMLDRGVGPEFGLEVRGDPALPGVKTEELGTKEYEGVRAEGTRTIAILPAGTIGNVRPIEIVSERWFSPELRVVVYSRRADPRFGETVYRLTNITRADPDPSLFQVPADYRQEDIKPLPFEPMVLKQ
jgi:hypothetical protein